MRQASGALLAGMLLAFGPWAAARADTIHLTNGRSVKGRITSRVGGRVHVQLDNGGRLILPSEQIESVEPDAEKPAETEAAPADKPADDAAEKPAPGGAGAKETSPAPAPPGPEATGPAAKLDLAKNLVGHWPLDEGSGTEAKDRSGKAKAGQILGAVWKKDADFGSVLSFDGADDYVKVPHDNSIDFEKQSFSVAFWFRTTNKFQKYALAKNYGPQDKFWGVAVSGMATPGGETAFVIHDGEKTSECGTLTAYTDGKWHHLAAVRDTKEVRLFLDGAVAATAPDRSGSLRNAADLWIGCIATPEVDRKQRYFEGELADVRIYKSALSAEEVAELHRLAGSARKPPDRPGTPAKPAEPAR